ncbi:P-loop containing nucleoside triphosphate hydrolase protein [Ustulina deusta]|nr:P-loop containing nucleoside triphosphate hydrolase protein [Ustulina deusta]
MGGYSSSPTAQAGGGITGADLRIAARHANKHDDRDARALPGDEDEQHYSFVLPLVPKKRSIDNEGDRQKKRVEIDNTSSARLHSYSAFLPDTSMNSKEKSREELRQAILAVGKGISFTRAKAEHLNRVARALGLHDCQGPDDKWSIEGLLQPLYPHQLLAVYFMLKRELSKKAPWGGLNADAMGLGKTVETLATVVMNRPDEHDLHEGRKATLWVAPPSSHSQVREAVRKFCCEKKVPNVLIYNKAALTKIHGDDLDSFLQEQDIIIVGYESLIRDCPAQLITKDDRTHMSPEEFKTNHINSFGPLTKMKFYRVILDEAHRIKNIESRSFQIYPYLLFLQVPQVKDMSCTFEELCDADEGPTELGQILKTIMIRRISKDTILGRQLIELPIEHHETILVSQTQEERAIYKWFGRRARENFNSQLSRHRLVHKQKEKGKERQPFSIVEILRLRQMSCDLSLIEYMINTSEVNIVSDMVSGLAHHSEANVFYDMIAQWCEDQKRANLTSATLQSQSTVSGNEANASASRQEGPKYLQKPKLPFASRYFANDERNSGQPMILGSKMQAVKESIQKHLTDGPNDKLLIFNEFLYCANIIGYILDELEIKHVYYFGTQSQDDRNEAVETFKHDPELKVMVLSMRCASEALNLAFANRVIVVEPWWNKGLEEQAFGRVYRLGQEKQTYHTRIIAKKTIETSMVSLQDAKEISIADALEGKFSGEISALQQNAGLFGRVGYDNDGNIISVSDDEDSNSDSDSGRSLGYSSGEEDFDSDSDSGWILGYSSGEEDSDSNSGWGLGYSSGEEDSDKESL